MTDDTRDPLIRVYYAGRSGTDADAAAWRARIDSDPEDMPARASWLGWSMERDLIGFLKSAEFGAQLVWLVTNHPDSPLLGIVGGFTSAEEGTGLHQQLRPLWLAAVEREPNNMGVLHHAATFFGLTEPERKAELLEKARSLAPNDPHQEHLLALHWLGQSRRHRRWDDQSPYRLEDDYDPVGAGKALEHAERAITLSPAGVVNEWYEVTRIWAATAAGMWPRAEDLAARLLRATSERGAQQVTGNVAFHANRILGHAALRRNDLAAAKQHLLLSCSGGTSPQLSSFGPDWSLARELLERGERAAVLEFLANCRTIWFKHDDALDYWELQIQRGERCSFSRWPKHILRSQSIRRSAPEPDDRDPATIAYVRGSDASDAEAEGWEKRLAEDPEDLAARAAWLGWCHKRRHSDKSLRQRIRAHLEWLARSVPDHPFTPGICSSFCQPWGPLKDPALIESLTRIWKELVEERGASATVIGNAGTFFLSLDPRLSLELFARAEALDASNPEWPASMARAQLKRAREGRFISPASTTRIEDLHDPAICQLALEAAERASALGTRLAYCDERLLTHMTAAAGARRWERAAEIAREALLRIPAAKILDVRKERCLHHAHLMLGHAALRQGDREEARSRLKESIACFSSSTPHFMNPNPSLALELLALGEREVMLEFLESMRPLHKDDQARIDLWQREVRSGRTPDFGSGIGS